MTPADRIEPTESPVLAARGRMMAMNEKVDVLGNARRELREALTAYAWTRQRATHGHASQGDYEAAKARLRAAKDAHARALTGATP